MVQKEIDDSFNQTVSEEKDESDIDYAERQKEKQTSLILDEGNINQTLNEIKENILKLKNSNEKSEKLLNDEALQTELNDKPVLKQFLTTQIEEAEVSNSVINGITNILAVMDSRRIEKEKAITQRHMVDDLPIGEEFMQPNDSVVEKVNLLHQMLESSKPFVNQTFSITRQFRNLDEALDNFFTAVGIISSTTQEETDNESINKALKRVTQKALENDSVRSNIQSQLKVTAKNEETTENSEATDKNKDASSSDSANVGTTKSDNSSSNNVQTKTKEKPTDNEVKQVQKTTSNKSEQLDKEQVALTNAQEQKEQKQEQKEDETTDELNDLTKEVNPLPNADDSDKDPLADDPQSGDSDDFENVF